jgi:hypothetical protein
MFKPEAFMKTKETLEPNFVALEKLNPQKKPKSLRPMRSMVAVRSLKPRTNVAAVQSRPESIEKNSKFFSISAFNLS